MVLLERELSMFLKAISWCRSITDCSDWLTSHWIACPSRPQPQISVQDGAGGQGLRRNTWCTPEELYQKAVVQEWLRCIVIKAPQVLQSGSVAQLVLVLCLHHGRPLCAQGFNRLEQIHHPLISHPLQDNTESDENTCSSHSSTAVHSDWSILPKLLLGFMNLPNEIDEPLTGFWHSLLWPISELELANGSGLTVPGICDFELSQDVLGHVVFGHGIHYEVLIAG